MLKAQAAITKDLHVEIEDLTRRTTADKKDLQEKLEVGQPQQHHHPGRSASMADEDPDPDGWYVTCWWWWCGVVQGFEALALKRLQRLHYLEAQIRQYRYNIHKPLANAMRPLPGQHPPASQPASQPHGRQHGMVTD